MTYSAERALLLREGMEARLVMREGVALAGGTAGELTAVRFDEFVFDLSDLHARGRRAGAATVGISGAGSC